MSIDTQFVLFLPLLLATSLTLLLIPFYPAWREWQHPTDDRPLLVAASQTESFNNLAQQLRDKAFLKFSEGAVVIHQVSSAQVIYMARKCCFEKLHAPVIYFGDMAVADPVSTSATPLDSFSMEHVAGATPWGRNGWRIKGDYEIPDDCFFKGSLVVTGCLSIGTGARVEGDLKAYKGIFIGENTQVTGAVFCEGGIHISRNCNVGGPVVADTQLLIGFNSVLGSATALTTITANSVLIANGVVAHGTVWASEAGVVWGQL